MAYVEPPITSANVEELLLDTENFRFPNPHASDLAAMNYLFEAHDALDVAKMILQSGYFDNEIPLVVPEGGFYVLLEGNRRVAALRALRDPSLVPNHQAALERLLKRYADEAQDLPTAIRVMVVPSREAAAPHLARLHIGENKKAWDLDEQAKFVLAQLGDGVDVQTLKALLPGIPNVPRLVRMGRMRELLGKVKFVDPAVADYAHRDLKMSVFEYAYKDATIQKLMGIAFAADGNLLTKPTTPQQVAVLERILEGFKNGELSTRKVLPSKQSDEYKEFLVELRLIAGEAAPGPDANTASTSEDGATQAEGEPTSAMGDAETKGVSGEAAAEGVSSGSGETAAAASKGAKGPNNPNTKATLVMGFDYGHVSTGMQKRLIELRSMDVVKHPIATGMLLRSVVESAAKEHYLSIGSGFSTQAGLDEIAAKLFKDYGKVGGLKHALELLKNAKNSGGLAGSTLWFNRVAHEPSFPIDPQAIRDAWQALQPLVKFLLLPQGSAKP